MVEFFDGSVGEAIKSVQERNRCLLVTVQDDSNACEEMETRLWTDSSVVEAISEAEFTCLMIKADTQDYVYFGSFFPVYVFPTVYILAPNGKPLAYFATSVPKSELLVKVQESASKLQEESSSKKEQKRTSETNAGPTGIPKPVAREEGSTAPDTARSSQTPDSVPSAPAEPTAESSKRPTSEENASPEPIQTEERDARGKGMKANYKLSSKSLKFNASGLLTPPQVLTSNPPKKPKRRRRKTRPVQLQHQRRARVKMHQTRVAQPAYQLRNTVKVK
uniref:Uncharacterized protein n=1 Tax=Rhodosorus marinus TaxID=101924 RepID=A0A7S3EFZ9_9RHOD|mmetsp:Transcript_31258/g.120404  ORF Transcript_31258/g.120404 Transcript_31258/m.120404 type:complete len:277 (+) Transcript_31258:394-1224(+)